MATAKLFDLIVIGGGSGGSATAKRAAAYGAKVVLVERGASRDANGVRKGAGVGGTCVNVGCVPKKMMFQCSQLRENMVGHISVSKGYGFNVPESAGNFDWTNFKKARDAAVSRLNGIYKGAWEKAGIEVVMGLASFVDAHTVKVAKADGSTQLLTGKRILIACGGEPASPPIPGAELAVTSDGFFDLETQPKKAAVIGAGYIAVEMAGIFNGLGTDTSLFFRGQTVLRRGFDKYIVDALMKSMEAHGPHLFPGSSPVALEKADDGTITVVMKDGQRQGGFDCVMMAIGRKPVTDLLNLEAAGLAANNRGYIEVDAYENTKVENIYCLGDASTTGYELTPVAIAAGRRLADRLFGGAEKARLEYRNIATVVFSHPPIGTIGYTEEQAREAFGADNVTTKQARFGSMIYSFNPEENKVKTALKLILAGPEETVVGVHCIGPASDEMIQGFAVAVKMGATRRDFESSVAIHPTIGEELVTMAGWGQKKDAEGTARPWLAPYCDEPEQKPFVTPKLLLGAAIGVLIGGLTATFFRSKV